MPQAQSRLIVLLLFLFCSATCISQNLDIDLLKNINPEMPNSTVWRGMSASVSPVVIGLPVGMYLVSFLDKNKTGKTNALHIAGGIVSGLVLTQAFKYVIRRDRPFVTYPLDIHPFKNELTPSFPSQHTSFAFATATVLALHYRKWYVVVPAFVWASAVGYSRLYLGAHYPSDVVAGALLGTGSAIISEWMMKKITCVHK